VHGIFRIFGNIIGISGFFLVMWGIFPEVGSTGIIGIFEDFWDF
jgi:hypothetical protein